MFRSNEEEIESRFAYLLISVQSALEANNVNVEEVRQVLITMFHRDDCIPTTNLCEIFNSVTVNNLWNYEHHSPVEKIIRRFIPDHLSLITEYQDHLCGFYTTTKIIEYMRNKNLKQDMDIESREHSLTTKQYQRLTLRLNIDRKISELSMLYVRDLWISFANQFNIPSLTAIIDNILEGSLEIVWLIPPHVAEVIVTCAHKSVPFFRQHNIIYVAIDDHIVYTVQLKVSTFTCISNGWLFVHSRLILS